MQPQGAVLGGFQGGVWRFAVTAFTTDIEELKLQDSVVCQV